MFRLLKSREGPFGGRIKHFFYRVEYQERGHAHVHCLLWLIDAPIIGVNSEKEIIEFLNTRLTCRMPDPDKEPILHKLVKKYQQHVHSSKFFYINIVLQNNVQKVKINLIIKSLKIVLD